MNWERIFYWGLVIFIIFIIYQVILKILGGSWGFEQLVITMLASNLALTYYLHTRVSNVDSKISKHLSEVDSKLSESISNINSKLSEHIGWHRGKGDQI